MPVEEIARVTNTIPYDLLCRVGQVQRLNTSPELTEEKFSPKKILESMDRCLEEKRIPINPIVPARRYSISGKTPRIPGPIFLQRSLSNSLLFVLEEESERNDCIDESSRINSLPNPSIK